MLAIHRGQTDVCAIREQSDGAFDISYTNDMEIGDPQDCALSNQTARNRAEQTRWTERSIKKFTDPIAMHTGILDAPT